MRCRYPVTKPGKQIMATLDEITNLHQQIKKIQPAASQEIPASLNELDKQAALIEHRPSQDTTTNLSRLYNAFTNAFIILEETDMRPTVAVMNAVTRSNAELKQLLATWANIKTNELSNKTMR
jgi:hypothetical protein